MYEQRGREYKMRKVEVLPYDSIWPHLYLEEKKKTEAIFGNQLVSIHHIGSTAVPGLAAKPILDIMIVVAEIERVDEVNNSLMEIGYEAMGENGIKRRRYFQKGGDMHTHHLHVYAEGDMNITRHLAFRDYLRAFSGEAERYGHLKLELAKIYPSDIESYISGKDIFVQVMEIKAMDWYHLQQPIP